MAEGIGNQDACGNVEEKYGVRIERRPSQSRLSDLDIRSWPKWACPPGKFPLKFDAEETFYLVKGKVRAYMKGSSEQYVDFVAGDLVIIPKGTISCTWDVSVAVDKHYKFEHSLAVYQPVIQYSSHHTFHGRKKPSNNCNFGEDEQKCGTRYNVNPDV